MPASFTSLPNRVLQLISIFTNEPQELFFTCKLLQKVSKSGLFRASWLLKRPQIICDWANQMVKSRSNSELQWWLAALSQALGPRSSKFPDRIINDNVIAVFIDAAETQHLAFMLGGSEDNVVKVLRASWSLLCRNGMLNGLLALLQDPAAAGSDEAAKVIPQQIRLVLDATSWRETIYTSIMARDALGGQLLATLVKLNDNAKQVTPRDESDHHEILTMEKAAPDAIILAARNGNLAALEALLSDAAGFHETGLLLDLLRVAAGNGHTGIVSFLINRVQDSTLKQSLTQTFNSLNLFQQAVVQDRALRKDMGVAANDRKFAGPLGKIVSSVVETWRSSENCTTEEILQRWGLAVDMAAEQGLEDLLSKLLAALNVQERAAAAAAGGLPGRTLWLALLSGKPQVIDLAVQDKSSGAVEWKQNVRAGLAGLLAEEGGHNKVLVECLRRTCLISNKDFAAQLQTLPNVTYPEAAATVKRDGVLTVLTRNLLPKNVLNSTEVEDILWSAFQQGQMEAAQHLLDCGLKLSWMEKAQESRRGSLPDTVSGSSNSELPPLAMALFASYGGTWTGGELPPVLDSDVMSNIVANRKGSLTVPITPLTPSLNSLNSGTLTRGQKSAQPRLIVNPEDPQWTAFLNNTAQQENIALSWMEPVAQPTSPVKKINRSRVDSADSFDSNGSADAWRDILGASFDGSTEGLSFYMGLGGVIPDNSTRFVAKPSSKLSPAGSQISKTAKRLQEF